MPVLSYVAIPRSGAMEELLKTLSAMPFCETFPADNKEVLVLVTDTPDDNSDKELYARLKELPNLESLSMTFGYNDEQQQLGEGDGYEGQ